jgi:hypothetical protein
LAYYIHSKRGAGTDIFEVGESSAKQLERPFYDLPFHEVLQREGARTHTRFDSETPVRWASNSRLILLRRGRTKVFGDPLEFVDYEYEVDLECSSGIPVIVDLRQISVVRFADSAV